MAGNNNVKFQLEDDKSGTKSRVGLFAKDPILTAVHNLAANTPVLLPNGQYATYAQVSHYLLNNIDNGLLPEEVEQRVNELKQFRQQVLLAHPENQWIARILNTTPASQGPAYSHERAKEVENLVSCLQQCEKQLEDLNKEIIHARATFVENVELATQQEKEQAMQLLNSNLNEALAQLHAQSEQLKLTSTIAAQEQAKLEMVYKALNIASNQIKALAETNIIDNYAQIALLATQCDQLRQYQPVGALPFDMNALELLKSIGFDMAEIDATYDSIIKQLLEPQYHEIELNTQRQKQQFEAQAAQYAQQIELEASQKKLASINTQESQLQQELHARLNGILSPIQATGVEEVDELINELLSPKQAENKAPAVNPQYNAKIARAIANLKQAQPAKSILKKKG